MFDTYLRGHHLGSLCVAGFIEILAFFWDIALRT